MARQNSLPGILAIAFFLAVCSSQGLAQSTNTKGHLIPILYTLLLEEGSDQCSKEVTTETTTTGVLSSDCVVEELAERYFTRFYTFKTDQDAEIIISVSPDQALAYEPHVVLRQGVGPDGEELYFADPAEDGSAWQIVADLEASEFTIEVSSISQQVLDTFSLSVARVVR